MFGIFSVETMVKGYHAWLSCNEPCRRRCLLKCKFAVSSSLCRIFLTCVERLTAFLAYSCGANCMEILDYGI